MFSENAHLCEQNLENGIGFDFFLERCHKDGYEFCNHIVRVTNDETKEQSKQWMHAHSPDKPKKFKQMMSARKLMAAVFWEC
jgi:hypothetical protein